MHWIGFISALNRVTGRRSLFCHWEEELMSLMTYSWRRLFFVNELKKGKKYFPWVINAIGVSKIPVSPEVRYFCVPTSTEKSQLDWPVCFAHYVRIILWLNLLSMNQYCVTVRPISRFAVFFAFLCIRQ